MKIVRAGFIFRQIASKRGKTQFTKQVNWFVKITLENINESLGLLDSIRYICEYNSFDSNFDVIEDFKNPNLPEGGRAENNKPVHKLQYLNRFPWNTMFKIVLFARFWTRQPAW